MDRFEGLSNDQGRKVLIVIAVISLYCFYKFSSKTKSSDIEPPTIYPKIPFVSHIWNMIWGQFEYFVKLR